MSSPLQFNSVASAKLPPGPLHLAIGMFDGVHRGHRAVIGPAVSAARGQQGVAAVLTFWPHPSVLFRPNDPTRLIQTPEAKRHALGALGVGAVITEPFTPAFAQLAADAFLPWLKEQLPTLVAVYVGENFRFGHRRCGNVDVLRATGERVGVQVASAPRLTFAGEPVSSTRIRAHLAAGEIEAANSLLGYPYFSLGVVTPGKQLGRTIGVPTLNLPWSPELRPRFGVYAVKIGREGRAMLPAVANYGLRPTVENATEPRLEVHVLGNCPFDSGDRLLADWLHFLRPEQKFSGLAELQRQIAIDCEAAVQRLAVR